MQDAGDGCKPWSCLPTTAAGRLLPLIAHHALEEADQFFFRSEGKLDSPSPALSNDPHPRLETTGEFLFGVPCERVAVPFALNAIASGHACCPFLGLADRQGSAHDFLGEKLLVVGRRQREQSLGMSGGEFTASDPVPDLRR